MSDEVRFAFLGYPEAEPTLRLDYREFAYAGKFVVSTTGKAALYAPETTVDRGDERAPDDGRADADHTYDRGVLAAVAFDADRTDPDRLVLRYVTVRRDRRGEGLGPRLVAGLLERAHADGRFERARIAVNNPYAYEALHRAGFAYTGEQTGLAELVLARPVATPATVAPARYRAGLERFRERDLGEEERTFLERRLRRGPPAVDADGSEG